MTARRGTLGCAAALAALAAAAAAQDEARLRKAAAELPPREHGPFRGDWLVARPEARAGLFRGDDPREIALDNGLVRRVLRVVPNAATVRLDDLAAEERRLRAVEPEAVLELDGRTYAVGGLAGQPDRSYLLFSWLDAMGADPAAFRCVGFRPEPVRERVPWKRARHAPGAPWPPPGAGLALEFAGPPGPHERVRVEVRYEIYDGLPLLAKWLAITNDTGAPVRLGGYDAERLAMVEEESDSSTPPEWLAPRIHVESEYSFGGSSAKSANRVVRWLPDPQHGSQVNYERKTPSLLVARAPLGAAAAIAPGETLETPALFELLLDTRERERAGLAVRRMYRAVAPWSQENPILMHVRSAEPAAVRLALDQCAEAGFEMAILTFGSGVDLESEDGRVLETIRGLADYGRARGIELGGYSLLSSRRISDEDDVVDPKTGKPGGAIFGSAPCLGSRWGIDYFRRLRAFVEKTGISVVEHDGSYPGDVCASTAHPGHAGLADSQWAQWRSIASFYRWCRERGVYLNVPDWYFLAGSNKAPMGYREDNWSLPRDRQVILGRQNLFDGTWGKTPSMGWMFVPLVEYHGGGAAATLEPLAEHLADYERHLVNNFGAGAQACYRGPRLFDTDATKAVVQKWVSFFKAHRAILESDVVHWRRADGDSLDGLLHVNPWLPERALLVLHNPTNRPESRTVEVPLYYAGLRERARVRGESGKPIVLPLDERQRLSLPVFVPAAGSAWFVFEAP